MRPLERLSELTSREGSPLCCGLDPVPERLASSGVSFDRRGVRDFLLSAVDDVHDLVCGFKVQRAYFDMLGADGYRVLRDVVTHIRRTAQEKFIILDAKLGDIEASMRAYATYAFSGLGVDCITLSPYMGAEVWKVLAEWPSGCGAVLVRTSNAGAECMQDWLVGAGEGATPLWQQFLRRVVDESEASPIFPVFSHRDPEQIREARSLIPDGLPVMFAGFGMQGVTADLVGLMGDIHGGGVLAPSSRALLFGEGLRSEPPADALRSRAAETRQALRYAFGTRS